MKSKEAPDFLNPIALKNAYYVTHNAPDGLDKFGFKWDGAKKRKRRRNNYSFNLKESFKNSILYIFFI